MYFTTALLSPLVWLLLCAAPAAATAGPEKPASHFLKLLQSPDNQMYVQNKHKGRKIRGTVVVQYANRDTAHRTVELEPGTVYPLGPVAPDGASLAFTLQEVEYASPAETGTPAINQVTIERGDRCAEGNRGRQVWVVNQNGTYSILAIVEMEGLATGTARTVERLVPPLGRVLVDCEVITLEGSLTDTEEAAFHINGARLLR